MVKACCVKNCPFRIKKDDKKISLHRFPTNDGNLLQRWVDFLDYGRDWTPTKYAAICSLHFTADDFRLNTNLQRLKPNAIPSIKDGTSKPSRIRKSIAPPVKDPYNFYCRLCGVAYKSELKHILNGDDSCANKIEKCLHIIVTPVDKLPLNICLVCEKKLNQCFEFVELVHKSQDTLKKLFEKIEAKYKSLSLDCTIFNRQSSVNVPKHTVESPQKSDVNPSIVTSPPRVIKIENPTSPTSVSPVIKNKSICIIDSKKCINLTDMKCLNGIQFKSLSNLKPIKLQPKTILNFSISPNNEKSCVIKNNFIINQKPSAVSNKIISDDYVSSVTPGSTLINSHSDKNASNTNENEITLVLNPKPGTDMSDLKNNSCISIQDNRISKECINQSSSSRVDHNRNISKECINDTPVSSSKIHHDENVSGEVFQTQLAVTKTDNPGSYLAEPLRPTNLTDKDDYSLKTHSSDKNDKSSHIAFGSKRLNDNTLPPRKRKKHRSDVNTLLIQSAVCCKYCQNKFISKYALNHHVKYLCEKSPKNIPYVCTTPKLNHKR